MQHMQSTGCLPLTINASIYSLVWRLELATLVRCSVDSSYRSTLMKLGVKGLIKLCIYF
jgi:hypothetical protein